MKSRIVYAVVIASLAFSGERIADRPKITAAEIAAADVLGSLGEPLGTCFRIKATITKGDNLNKGEGGAYFLTVTEVENQKLKSPIRTRFGVHRFATKKVKLANNDFELYELRMGKKASSLTHEQVVQLQKDYVGKSVSLVVYETGSFNGIPHRLPESVGPWQDYGFGFKTALHVMDQED